MSPFAIPTGTCCGSGRPHSLEPGSCFHRRVVRPEVGLPSWPRRSSGTRAGRTFEPAVWHDADHPGGARYLATRLARLLALRAGWESCRENPVRYRLRSRGLGPRKISGAPGGPVLGSIDETRDGRARDRLRGVGPPDARTRRHRDVAPVRLRACLLVQAFGAQLVPVGRPTLAQARFCHSK